MPQQQFLDMYRGENRTFTLAARDNSNLPSDLTGVTVTWALSFPPYAPEWNEAIITKTGTVTDATGGLYTIAITPSDTRCMAEGNYTHQAYTTDDDGSVSVVTEGTFHLRATVRPLT